jgi:hypothetical protein
MTIINFKTHGKKLPGSHLFYSPDISLEGLGKTTKNSVYIWCPDRTYNGKLPHTGETSSAMNFFTCNGNRKGL